MNKKEVNEIKALYDTVQDCGIVRLAGCYVNSDKTKVKTFVESFGNLPEEETHKYLEIFRKSLSGTLGKNLIDACFVDDEQENASSGKELLNALRSSELKDDKVLDTFYDKVIDAYNYTGNYLILLIFQAYDVPGVGADGEVLDDASDEVYSYVLCSICPMKLTKPGLGFDDALGEIHTLRQSFAVELPETGFLFPAFNDRSSDDSALLYYSKRTDSLQDLFFETVLRATAMLPAKQQKETFTGFVSDVLGDESSFETVLAIQENLKEAVKNKKSEAEGAAVFFDKEDMRDVFEISGVSEEKLTEFDRKFDDRFDRKRLFEKQLEDRQQTVSLGENAKDTPVRVPDVRVEEKFFADNVAPVRSYEIKSDNMVLRVNSKHTDMIHTRVIDGKKCLIIEITEDLTVNGIPVVGTKKL